MGWFLSEVQYWVCCPWATCQRHRCHLLEGKPSGVHLIHWVKGRNQDTWKLGNRKPTICQGKWYIGCTQSFFLMCPAHVYMLIIMSLVLDCLYWDGTIPYRRIMQRMRTAEYHASLIATSSWKFWFCTNKLSFGRVHNEKQTFMYLLLKVNVSKNQYCNSRKFQVQEISQHLQVV